MEGFARPSPSVPLRPPTRRRSERQLGEVPPAVIDQRQRTLAPLAALDFTHEDDMVAFFILAAVEALEHRGTAFEHRRTARALPEGHAGKTVDVFRGETLSQRALVGGEDVD